MNDPHVEWLQYRLALGSIVRITDPPPLDGETEHFTLRLEAGKLTVSMKEHHASMESAQNRVRQFLRSWELANDLRYGSAALRFLFEDYKLIDRNPPPPGSAQTITLSGIASVARVSGHAATLTVGRRDYPPPPPQFVASPEVELLWSRYERYLAGKEPLTGAAFFCLPLVEALALGKRKQAAEKLAIKPEILNVLGKLVSIKGDATTARKFPDSGVLQPHHPQEQSWMEAVVRALIRRMGEYSAGARQPKTLTMADFPQLPPAVPPSRTK